LPSWILSQTCISIETTNHLLLWSSNLANSSDLLFNIGPLTHTPYPVIIENHWLRTSSTTESLPSCFHFWEVSFCPWHHIHPSHTFSCCCIRCVIVDFGTPVGDDWC
jgi:hypothetical protein